ncbi:DUF2884 family protein [Dyella sp.]|uniref:DUF2884 family protein n=1 Tax=Dyella sp. TaxID=1869338 RepID=UPI002D79C407|nr:DUF2884 family protein [Dyella sp.]HET6431863.1 DUF2884 family protein [Dyella sp.]
MRKTLSLLALAIGITLGTQAQAHERHMHTDQCSFSTDYDVRVNAAGIAFSRDDGTPATVFMHDGHLRVDGHDATVTAADAERLRQYEASVRALLPEIAGIAREGLDIGFAAMTTVATTFAETADERQRLLVKLNRARAEAMQRIDRGIGAGLWTHSDMEDLVEDGMESAVSELVGTVTAGAVKAALSGDQARIAALEARADSLDKTIDREVDARADKLDARAQALCPRLASLDTLQQQLQFRLADGSPLQLIERAADRDDDDAKDRVATR